MERRDSLTGGTMYHDQGFAGKKAMNDGWQPIETAPKDGSNIIVAEGLHVSIAFWDEQKSMWLDAINHDGYEHVPRNPTKWMPFPSALSE